MLRTILCCFFFFFKHKTAYEMRISDWSSDVCSSDLGYIYSRFTNPTTEAFEKRLAAMEGGARCVATASGMAAVLTLCLSLLKQGDHIVSSRGLFGSTIGLFNNFLAKFGISVSYVALPDLAAWDAAVQQIGRAHV